jgi:SAM-dependent methyltransferase
MVQGINKYWVNKADDFHKIDNVEREILLPYIAEIVNDINPPKMLDYGCGSAYLSKLIDVNTEISLFDINRSIVDGYDKGRVKNKIVKIREHSKIPEDYFDVVVQSSVLMCIPSIDQIRNVFSTNYTALKNEGTLVLVITHPCFLQYQFGHYHTSFNHSNFDYLNDGLEYEVVMKQMDKEPIRFTDYHWKLSTILNEMINTGFTLNKMIEHKDLESKYPENNKLVTPWIFLIAQK